MPCIATNFPSLQQTAFVPVEKKAGELKIACISRMAPKKNIHYLLELLHGLPAHINLSLTLRGEFESSQYLEQCQAIKSRLPSNITVSFDGVIENERIEAFLQQQHIFALPTLGENFGHAIFEALRAGRPVLISDQTPWGNLESRHAGWDLPLSQPEAFRKVIIQLAAMTAEELNLWCRGAWNLANDFVAKTNIREQYKNLFNDDVHSRH
jgi:glycosyltransferase involved in cell wall biosynthesis